MSKNNYQYDDIYGLYTNLSTGVMWNKLGIENPDDLSVAEHLIVGQKIIELRSSDLTISKAEDLPKIHKMLFCEVYEWAGQVRKVNISKQGKQFFPLQSFDKGFAYINHLINEFLDIKSGETVKLAKELAEILDNINYLHPFREGNGRTQREFMRLLILKRGCVIDLNPPNRNDIYEMYMNGTINSDVSLLTELFIKLLKEAGNV